jgi:hypothetical protein
MIEREFIFLLGYTVLISFLAWLTFKVVAYIRVNDNGTLKSSNHV